MRPDNITLIGFMGSGKSSVSKALKHYYPSFHVADCDSLIESKTGKSISDIFSEEGEDIFRGLESIAIREVLNQEKTIVATGGGAVLRESNRQTLQERSWVVWLSTSPETIYERIKDEHHRPLINTGSDKESIIGQIRAILHKRFELYRDTMDVMINTDDLPPDQVAAAVHEEIERLKTCSKNA